jgi:hypothetical protein
MFSNRVRRGRNQSGFTNGLGDSLGLLGSVGDLTLGDTDTVLYC